MSDYANVVQNHLESRFEFIVTELDLAATFLDIANSSSDNPSKAARNREHARQAYEAAMRFLKAAELTSGMRDLIEEKLQRLRGQL
jgi:hypothetical protein